MGRHNRCTKLVLHLGSVFREAWPSKRVAHEKKHMICKVTWWVGRQLFPTVENSYQPFRHWQWFYYCSRPSKLFLAGDDCAHVSGVFFVTLWPRASSEEVCDSRRSKTVLTGCFVDSAKKNNRTCTWMGFWTELQSLMVQWGRTVYSGRVQVPGHALTGNFSPTRTRFVSHKQTEKRLQLEKLTLESSQSRTCLPCTKTPNGL